MVVPVLPDGGKLTKAKWAFNKWISPTRKPVNLVRHCGFFRYKKVPCRVPEALSGIKRERCAVPICVPRAAAQVNELDSNLSKGCSSQGRSQVDAKRVDFMDVIPLVSITP